METYFEQKLPQDIEKMMVMVMRETTSGRPGFLLAMLATNTPGFDLKITPDHFSAAADALASDYPQGVSDLIQYAQDSERPDLILGIKDHSLARAEYALASGFSFGGKARRPVEKASNYRYTIGKIHGAMASRGLPPAFPSEPA